MTLKAIVDSIDALPEVMREHYEEAGDGKYRLKVEPVGGWGLENIDGLKGALSEERAQVKALKEQTKAFEDLDPAKARDALKRLEKLAKENPEGKAAEQVEAIKRQMQEKLESREKELGTEAETWKKRCESLVIDNAAQMALAKHKGNVSLLLPHLKSMLRFEVDDKGEPVARVLDDNGNVRLTRKASSTDEMSIDELVEAMRNDERFAPGFAGTGASGGGASSTRGGSKGTSEEFNSLRPEDKLARLRQGTGA